MKEKIMEIIQFIAPLAAGFITSIVIPLITKTQTMKHLKAKIDEISEPAALKRIEEEVKSTKKEILEMRGKTK